MCEDCVQFSRYAEITNRLVATPGIEVKVVYGGSHLAFEDSKEGGMFHLKSTIIDSNLVLDGGYDPTYIAKHNNIEWHYLFDSTALAVQRTKDFQREWDSSQARRLILARTATKFQFVVEREVEGFK